MCWIAWRLRKILVSRFYCKPQPHRFGYSHGGGASMNDVGRWAPKAQQLPNETGYSRTHFVRMFHAATGQTPHHYSLLPAQALFNASSSVVQSVSQYLKLVRDWRSVHDRRPPISPRRGRPHNGAKRSLTPL